MRILLAHNYYQQPGGEDNVFACEAALLEEHGHEVMRYTEHNNDLASLPVGKLAAKTIWNRSSYQDIRMVIRRERPDVCHFHNTFPLMSPAVFHAAKSENVPVVMTLHNYRLFCPAYTFMRDGRICEDCADKTIAWPAVVHGCYRGSRPASAIVAIMLATHRALGTWSEIIDVYIALTEFARQKFIDCGLPASKIMVKSNSLAYDPGVSPDRGDHALFVGRLSAEKGIDTLLAAWRLLALPIRLRIAGDGPLAHVVRQAASEDSRIEWLGALQGSEVAAEMNRARVLLCPSIWYEGGLPLTVIEAFATGLPAIVSRIGGLPGLVETSHAGLTFTPGDAADLAGRVAFAFANPAEMRQMGTGARRAFERTYTPAANYGHLMQVYRRALDGQLLVHGERTNLPAIEGDVTTADHMAGTGTRGSGA